MYKHNFNEICQQIPFPLLLEHLKIPFKIDGNVIKTDEAIITPKKGEKDGYIFDLFVWRDKTGKPKGGGSVMDYAQEVLHLKSKTKAAEWLKTNILGEKEQRDDIPVLELSYDPIFEKFGISEKVCQDYEVGIAKGRSVMSGRMCFRIYDHEKKHRGYIGLDHLKTKKVLWYVPEGTKTSDVLYNYHRKNGNDYCLVVQTPLEAIYLCSLGFTYTLSLLNGSFSNERLDLMKSFKRVIFISGTATTAAIRLSTVCFVKCIETNVLDKTAEQIRNLF